MAVTFVIEDGSGKANATSYISEADADQLVEDFGQVWPSGFTAKEAALNTATRYIDQKFLNAWKGYAASAEQALQWPRSDVVTNSGWVVASNDIPAKLKQAVVEAALYWAENDKIFPDADSSGKLSKERIKIDVLEFEEEYLAGNSGSEVSESISALLADYTGGRGAMAEVERG